MWCGLIHGYRSGVFHSFGIYQTALGCMQKAVENRARPHVELMLAVLLDSCDPMVDAAQMPLQGRISRNNGELPFLEQPLQTAVRDYKGKMQAIASD